MYKISIAYLKKRKRKYFYVKVKSKVQKTALNFELAKYFKGIVSGSSSMKIRTSKKSHLFE